MKKHWLNFLSEAGKKVKEMGFKQECKAIEIERVKENLRLLEKQYEMEEDSIFWWIKENWSIEEILEAKRKSIEQ